MISLYGLNAVSAQQQLHLSAVAKQPGREKSISSFGAQLFNAYPFQLQANGALAVEKNNNKRFTAHIKNQRLHGSWQSWHINGQLLDEGKLQKGIPDGTWKVWDANGNLLAIRTYSADLFQRIKNEIQLNHPKRNFYALTSLYKKDGWSVEKYFNSSYSFYSNQLHYPISLEELVERNTTDIKQYHPAFNFCLHHGLYVNYYANGQVKDSGYYKEGLKDGIWLHGTETGSWKGAYKNGLPQHEWKFYNSVGKLTTIIFYNRNGKEEWRKQM